MNVPSLLFFKSPVFYNQNRHVFRSSRVGYVVEEAVVHVRFMVCEGTFGRIVLRVLLFHQHHSTSASSTFTCNRRYMILANDDFRM